MMMVFNDFAMSWSLPEDTSFLVVWHGGGRGCIRGSNGWAFKGGRGGGGMYCFGRRDLEGWVDCSRVDSLSVCHSSYTIAWRDSHLSNYDTPGLGSIV